LGASDIPYCVRKNILKKLNDIKTILNNKMMFGKLYEEVLYKRNVLKQLMLYLINQLDAFPKQIDTKKEDYWEVKPGYKIRMHPDIYTSLYTIEIKTTSAYKSSWTQKLAPYQVAQSNFYCGYYKHPMSFLHKINIRAFINTFESWDKLWGDYGYFQPIYFDNSFYKLCVERALFVFDGIENKESYVAGPEMMWECDTCEVKHLCKNPIKKEYIEIEEKCSHCKQPIELTKKKSGELSALCYSRNDRKYHGNHKDDKNKWEACRRGCINDWRYDKDV